MADLKISQLTALTAAGAVAADVLPVVDTSAATTKKIGLGDIAEFVSVSSAISTLLSAKANLASPTFTGTPAAPTAAVDTNTTQIATTGFVVGQGYLKSATAASTYAPLASPALTGTPTSTTAAVDTNTTQIATTAYVVGQGYLKSATAATTYIANSLVDAKGDLIVATADNTVTRLAVGTTNNHVLLVDSSTATGLKWAAVPAPTIVWEDDQNILANAVFG